MSPSVLTKFYALRRRARELARTYRTARRAHGPASIEAYRARQALREVTEKLLACEATIERQRVAA